MTPLVALWLPILLSAVLVFIASAVIHMFLGYHGGDFAQLPDEARFADAVRPMAIPPGDYIVPRAKGAADMKSPEYRERREKGPVMVMTVFANGITGMGTQLVQWFVYVLVVSVLAAYVAGRALPPGTDYLEVFRFTGTTAFIGYAVALWHMSIWYRRKWSTTIKDTIDGLVYGLLTAGAFGWLWPA